MQEGRDFWWDEEAEKVQSYCPCEPVNSEDPLFILYVSLPFLSSLSSSTLPPNPLPRSNQSTLSQTTSGLWVTIHLHTTSALRRRRSLITRPPDPLVNPKESSIPPQDTSSVPSFP